MHIHFSSRVAVGVIAVTGLLACDSKTSPTGPPGVVALEMSGAFTIAPGATTQLTLSKLMTDGSRTDVTSTALWSVFNLGVATSVGPGRIQAKTFGDTLITARDGRVSVSREMIVVPEGTYRLTGSVTTADSPFTGLADAQIRVSDGSGAGPSAITVADGTYRLYGVAGETDVIVRREGYTEHAQRLRVDGHTTRNFALALAAPRLSVAGSYAATFDWSQCSANFRDELRRRVYIAEITQNAGLVSLRFTSPSFATQNGVPGNVIEGTADTATIRIATSSPPDENFYGGTSRPLIEILPDDTRLVTSLTATLSPTAIGFTGTLTGEATHNGRLYPFDSQFGNCSSGTLTLDRN